MGKMYDKHRRRRVEEELAKPPFRPPRQHETLEEAIGVPGVLYKLDDRVRGLYVRKSRGRVVLRTNLPLWLLPDPAMGQLRHQLRELLAGRTGATGFSWRTNGPVV